MCSGRGSGPVTLRGTDEGWGVCGRSSGSLEPPTASRGGTQAGSSPMAHPSCPCLTYASPPMVDTRLHPPWGWGLGRENEVRLGNRRRLWGHSRSPGEPGECGLRGSPAVWLWAGHLPSQQPEPPLQMVWGPAPPLIGVCKVGRGREWNTRAVKLQPLPCRSLRGPLGRDKPELEAHLPGHKS